MTETRIQNQVNEYIEVISELIKSLEVSGFRVYDYVISDDRAVIYLDATISEAETLESAINYVFALYGIRLWASVHPNGWESYIVIYPR